jgi:hypothetical protein
MTRLKSAIKIKTIQKNFKITKIIQKHSQNTKNQKKFKIL